MKKGLRITLIIIAILLLIGIAYYFLIAKKSGERGGSNGSNSSSGGGVNASNINIGDEVYLQGDKSSWAGDNGIPVYSQPKADSQGSFLQGVVRGDWYAGQPIGKVVASQPGWTQVELNNMQIWKFAVSTGYTTVISHLTGKYWFSDKALFKL